MDPVSIKQYAEGQHVSYEAVRKQVARYRTELKDHISTRNRTQYLDEWAVDFLTQRRRESPITVEHTDNLQRIRELEQQVQVLTAEAAQAYKRLSAAEAESKEAYKQLSALQGTVREALEDKTRYDALSQENEQNKADLAETIETLEETKLSLLKMTDEKEKAEAEAASYEKTWFGLYRKKH